MKTDKLITLAIHKNDKARILKEILEKKGIEVVLEEINKDSGEDALSGISVRIKETDLNRALSIVEEQQLFRYDDERTYSIDDGRRRILVAVDFSEYSMNACRMAFNVAKRLNAKVKILHVYYRLQFPTQLPFAEILKDKNELGLLDRVRKQMLDLCCEIDKKITEGEFPSVNYSYSIREGIVEEEVEQFVKEYKPVLLVLGTKGLDNNQSHILGSVAADIIEMTNVPVLAVPEKTPVKSLKDIKHIAFLTNMQSRDLASFDHLVNNMLNPYYNVKITLLHINRINRGGDRWTEAELLGMKTYFEKHYPQVNVQYKLIDTPDVQRAVEEFIDKDKVDIISLNTRRRNILGRMFVPSMSRKVLFGIDAILLVLRG